MRLPLLVILSALLLVACGPSDADIQAAIAQTQAAQPTSTPEPTKTPRPTKTPEQTPTENQVAAYIIEFQPLLSSWFDAYDVFSASFKQLVNDPNLVTDDEWKRDSMMAVATMSNYADKMRELPPPPPELIKHREYSDAFADATDELKLYYLILISNPGDSSYILSLAGPIDKLNNNLDLMTIELKKITP